MVRLISLLVIIFYSLGSWTLEYSIDFSKSTQTLKLNEQGMLVIDIRLASQVRLNEEAPFNLKLETTKSIQLRKTELSLKDISKKETNFFQLQLPFQAQGKGEQEVKGKLHFFLCTSNTCNAIDGDFVIKVTVLQTL